MALALTGAAPALAQNGQAAPAPPAATPVDSGNLAIAQEVVALAFPPDKRHEMVMSAGRTMIDQTRSALLTQPEAQAGGEAMRIFDRFMDRLMGVIDQQSASIEPALFDALARAYARRFSHDDLVEIRAFVRTPAGQHYFQRAQDVLTDPDVARVNRAYMTSLIEAMRPLQDEIMQEVRNSVTRRPHRGPPRS